jgi:hypothetical protein
VGLPFLAAEILTVKNTNHAKGGARHFRRCLAMAGQAVRAVTFFSQNRFPWQNRALRSLEFAKSSVG